MKELNGRVALVTGASSGLGARFARILADAGANIAGPALDVDADAIDAVMAVNVRGVFLTAREGARRMIAVGSPETKRGRIVIISSITATGISPGLALYAAS